MLKTGYLLSFVIASEVKQSSIYFHFRKNSVIILVKMKKHIYYVYIMFNRRNGTLYVGVTNDIVRRVHEHQRHLFPDSFTAKYGCDKLGYYEEFQYVNDALEREKKLKAGCRATKIQLIESINPQWLDLSQQDMFWIR